MRLWINNQLVVDAWSGDWLSGGLYSGQIALVGGQSYPIKLEFRDNYYNAETRLYWSSTSQLEEIVPTTALSTSTQTSLSLTMVPDVHFAANSYVHTPLSPTAPLDPMSSVWVNAIASRAAKHYSEPEAIQWAVNLNDYTPAIWIANANTPTVKVKVYDSKDPYFPTYPVGQALQAQWTNVPLPAGFTPSTGTDKEALVYQPSTGQYWEFWLTEKSGAQVYNSAGQLVDEWRARWGGRINNLATNPGYFPVSPEGFKFGTTATSLALLAGLMTIEEQKAGVINHPIHFSLPNGLIRQGAWTFPAQRSDGQSSDINAIPQGATFRLPASFDVNTISDPYCRMMARAVQRYGLILRDSNGWGTGGWATFYAENPAGRYPVDPYYGVPGTPGILSPAGGFAWTNAPDSNNRLREFPWSKLQVLQTNIVSQ